MSIMEWRGGFPAVFAGEVATDGAVTDTRGVVHPAGTSIRMGEVHIRSELDGRKGPIDTKWVRIANLGSGNQIIRVYFTEDHFNDDVHYVSILAASDGLSIWEGPAEVRHVWLRSEADTPSFDITAFSRRA